MINHTPKHRTMIKNHSPSTQGSSAVVQSNYMGTSQNHSVTRCTATLEDSVIFSTQSFISSSVSTRISKGGPWWRVMMRKAYLSPRGCSGSGNNNTTSTLQHFCSDLSPCGCSILEKTTQQVHFNTSVLTCHRMAVAVLETTTQQVHFNTSVLICHRAAVKVLETATQQAHFNTSCSKVKKRTTGCQTHISAHGIHSTLLNTVQMTELYRLIASEDTANLSLTYLNALNSNTDMLK